MGSADNAFPSQQDTTGTPARRTTGSDRAGDRSRLQAEDAEQHLEAGCSIADRSGRPAARQIEVDRCTAVAVLRAKDRTVRGVR